MSRLNQQVFQIEQLANPKLSLRAALSSILLQEHRVSIAFNILEIFSVFDLKDLRESCRR